MKTTEEEIDEAKWKELEGMTFDGPGSHVEFFHQIDQDPVLKVVFHGISEKVADFFTKRDKK